MSTAPPTATVWLVERYRRRIQSEAIPARINEAGESGPRDCLFHNVSECSVAGLPLGGHAVEYWHSAIGVVVDDHLPLGLVFAMQPADILRERAGPRDRHGQEQRIQPRIIEAFSEIPARRQDQAFLTGGNKQSRLCSVALRGRHAAPEHDQMPDKPLEARSKQLKVIAPLG